MSSFKKGQSTLEYIALITFIIAAFFVFQKYIVRGFSGRWKATGDTWGHGRQYDPALTVNCKFIQVRNSSGVVTEEFWYDEQCDTASCFNACYDASATKAGCIGCKRTCGTNKSVCSDTANPSPF